MIWKECRLGTFPYFTLQYQTREGMRNIPRSRINLNHIRYLRIYYPLDCYANSTWILLNVSFICLHFWISNSAVHFKVQNLTCQNWVITLRSSKFCHPHSKIHNFSNTGKQRNKFTALIVSLCLGWDINAGLCGSVPYLNVVLSVSCNIVGGSTEGVPF